MPKRPTGEAPSTTAVGKERSITRKHRMRGDSGNAVAAQCSSILPLPDDTSDLSAAEEEAAFAAVGEASAASAMLVELEECASSYTHQEERRIRRWLNAIIERGRLWEDRVASSQERMIKSVVNRFHIPDCHMLSREDLIACGRVGLMKALRKYDPHRKGAASFPTVAYMWVRQAVSREFAKNYSIITCPEKTVNSAARANISYYEMLQNGVDRKEALRMALEESKGECSEETLLAFRSAVSRSPWEQISSAFVSSSREEADNSTGFVGARGFTRLKSLGRGLVVESAEDSALRIGRAQAAMRELPAEQRLAIQVVIGEVTREEYKRATGFGVAHAKKFREEGARTLRSVLRAGSCSMS